jgi:hypothetical protein
MTTLREAAQRLLTAIDCALPHAPPLGEFDFVADAADDLRAALAEPVQEPVATLYGTLPVYDTDPPQRKPLTDEEILRLVGTHVGGVNPGNLDNSDWIQFARAVEAAHGIVGKT